MRRQVALAFFVLSALVASGCQGLFGSQPASLPDHAALIYAGSDGISMRFAPGAPPDSLVALPGTPVPVTLLLENKGAPTVSTADVYLSAAVDDTLMSWERKDGWAVSPVRLSAFSPVQSELIGKEDNLVGDLASVDMTGVTVGRIDNRNDVPAVITAQACYRYTTRFSTRVCAQTNPYGSGPPQGCLSSLQFRPQGAPVAVTAVRMPTPTLLSNGQELTPVFEIHVANAGEGVVLNLGPSTEQWSALPAPVELTTQNLQLACTGGDVPESLFGVVYLVEATFRGHPLKCTGSIGETTPTDANPARLALRSGSEDIFYRCTVAAENALSVGESGGMVNSVLSLTLDYGYQVAAAHVLSLEGMRQPSEAFK